MGANYLCLHNNPKWPEVMTSVSQNGGRIYGVEYNDRSTYNDDAPCAVCHVDGRVDHLMIPGQRTCSQN